jgi:hypothetical protein
MYMPNSPWLQIWWSWPCPSIVVFSKQYIKTFVRGAPGILSFLIGHYQMNLTSLIANRYIYQDIFGEDGYM